MSARVITGTVLIIGGLDGIGATIAGFPAPYGYRVAINDRTEREVGRGAVIAVEEASFGSGAILDASGRGFMLASTTRPDS